MGHSHKKCQKAVEDLFVPGRLLKTNFDFFAWGIKEEQGVYIEKNSRILIHNAEVYNRENYIFVAVKFTALKDLNTSPMRVIDRYENILKLFHEESFTFKN